jgi:serine/threonine-protein kinase
MLFGSGFAFWSWDHAFIYPELRLAEPPFWFGMIMAVAVSGPWDFMIIAYGIFIPNTWRRCAAVVGVMAVAPIVISMTTSLAADASGGQSQLVYLLNLATYTGSAAALATYGAHRIEVLRQEAQAARRFGQYRLKQRLGAGGMGEVYLAEHVLLRRPCAIKLIRPERAADRNSLLRFEREVQVTATLTHPNTVEILDYGHADDGTFYYVMEHLPGVTLEEMVSRYGPLPPVDHADHKLTHEGAIAGTPAYMSPEQAAGKSDLDIRSDIYSLGAVACFLLTGKPPFVRQTAMQILAAHIYESPAAMPTEAGVPADLEAVVLRCMEKDPVKRFPDAENLEQALARCSCADRWTREQASAWWLDRRV